MFFFLIRRFFRDKLSNVCYAYSLQRIFPSDRSSGWNPRATPMCLLPRKRWPLGKHRRKDLSGVRVPRDTGVSLSLSLFLLHLYDLAHFVPHLGHTYAVVSRTSSKFTARERAAGTDARLRPRRAAPGRSSHLYRRRSHIFQIVQLPVSIRAEREIERERRRVDVGRSDEEEMMCTSCTQLIPTAERNECMFAAPHISLCWRAYFQTRTCRTPSMDFFLRESRAAETIDGYDVSFSYHLRNTIPLHTFFICFLTKVSSIGRLTFA